MRDYATTWRYEAKNDGADHVESVRGGRDLSLTLIEKVPLRY